MKKVLLAFVLMACMLFTAACSSGGSQEPAVPDYADDEAMTIIANGWNKRQVIVENIDPLADDYVEQLKEGIQAELDADLSLKDRQFEDSQLQEDVLAYINSLNGQMDVLNEYSLTDPKYLEKVNKAADVRAQLLKKFVEQYDLTVDPKYQSYMDDLVRQGSSASKNEAEKEAINSLVSDIQWEVEENYGYYTYTAVVENTSDYDYENVSLLVNLYDADDVKTESYASTSTWKKGEKVKFEVYGGEVNASRIDATVQYYTVVEE